MTNKETFWNRAVMKLPGSAMRFWRKAISMELPIAILKNRSSPKPTSSRLFYAPPKSHSPIFPDFLIGARKASSRFPPYRNFAISTKTVTVRVFGRLISHLKPPFSGVIPRVVIATAGIFLGSILSHADETQIIGPFGGLNTQDSPQIIGSNQAQDLLNVRINEGGRSVIKRDGYSLDNAFSISTSSIHGAYKFFDASGNEVRLWGQDTGLWASVSGASYVKVSSGTAGATWQCTDYLGQAYCVNSARDTPVRTNGTTSGTTFQGGIPAGTIIASTPERLLVAGTASNPSRIAYSAASDLTNFTVGSAASSSSFEDITSPGSRITHLAYRYGKWMWWKDQSFGFLVGSNQFDLQLVTIAPNLGTLDNESVYDQGMSYFRGNDNNFYSFDGSNYQRISRDITPTVQSANRRKANSWTQTSQTDFSAGTGVPSTYITFTNPSGSVALSTSIVLMSSPGFEDGPNNVADTITNWTISASGINITANQASAVTGCSGTDFSPYTGIYFATMGPPFGTDLDASIQLLDSSNNLIQSVTLPRGQCGWTQKYIVNYSSVGYSVKLRLVRPTQSDGNQTLTSNTFTWPGLAWFVYQSTATPLSGNSYYVFDNFITAPSTAVYYSAVNNAPNLTSWSNFAANDSVSTDSGTITYWTRSSTNPFTVTSSTPAWVSQSASANVSASTGTYFQLRADFTVYAATNAPKLNDFTFNWFEGSASDRMYGTYYDYALWFSVSLGTAATTNNRILRYDLLNQLWTIYDIPVNGFLTYNGGLYLGDSTVGRTYLYGGAQSDNGTTINAYWKSKDFFGNTPFVDKDMKTMSWYCKQSSGTTLSVNYTVNASSTTTYSINLYDTRSNVIRHNRNMPLTTANVFSVQIGDVSSNRPFECYAGQYTYFPKAWTPTQ